MTAIQIQGITADEFIDRIREEIAQAQIPQASQPNSSLEELLDTVIDRPFIERNLRVDYKRILKYEELEILRRVPHPDGRGGIFYLMSDYVKVYESELTRMKRKRRR